MVELPRGTVTFFFSDIAGSTRLVESLGGDYPQLLERHREIVRAALADNNGVEVETEGDSFFAAFVSPSDAVRAAVEIQQATGAEQWPQDADLAVRVGLHTGEGRVAGGGYVGLDVHRAARIMAAAHGWQILLSEATRTLAERSLEDVVELRDLGEHRLRDLSGTERLFQVVADGIRSDFPALRTLDATPNNLPTQLTSFLGREREIDEVAERLARSRLLTLTGPGGTGKTRLSLQVAARLFERFRDGVYFIPLAPISDAALVPATIAQHLGLHERGGIDPMRALLDHLRDRELLLVVDNFEQLLTAATVIGELLRESPHLSVLVTSRAALHISGEQEFPVPPMAVPDPRRLPAELTQLTQYESVALFIERAAAVRPDFAATNANAPAIAEICVRLDGLPLAIELAAARIGVLPPRAILKRLGNSLDLLAGGVRDSPDRQRTLRGTIGWSYDMLEDPDRSLFSHLSVFVGGASLSAVEAVCGDLVQGDVLEPLASLVEKSLITQREALDGEPRFTMLETIREYALERSVEGGSHAELRKRHAEWFADLSENARPMLMSGQRGAWLDRVEQEHDNIRAAITWAVEQGEAKIGLSFIGALWRFWQMRGYLPEGRDRALGVLSIPAAADHPHELLSALDAAGGIAYWRGQMREARAFYGQALLVARQLGDRGAEAEQLYNLSFTYSFLAEPERTAEDVDEARRLAGEALAIFTELEDRPGQGRTNWQLSNLEVIDANFDEARQRAEYALAISIELDDRFMQAWSRWMLAIAAFRQERYADTLTELRAALQLFAEAGDISGHVLILTGFAALAERLGDREHAARLNGAVSGLAAASGTGLVAGVREQFGYDPGPPPTDPQIAAAWADGERMGIEQARACAFGFELGMEPAAQGRGGVAR